MASQIAMNMTGIGRTMGTAIQNMGSYTAQAASRANAVSAASQAAQGAFNQASANLANTIGDDRTAQQYAFNSAMATGANDFTEYMWDKAAAFNREMLNQQMEFNSKQAEINRQWQEKMRATAYQTAVKDMETAGLNPILAATGGGIQTGGGSGAQASIGLPQMSSASGALASGGLMNGIAASEGNFQGQMEYMGGMLGLISMVMNGFSSAFKGLGSLGDFGEGLGQALGNILKNGEDSFTNAWNKAVYHAKNDSYYGMGLESIRGAGGEGARAGKERTNFIPFIIPHK